MASTWSSQPGGVMLTVAAVAEITASKPPESGGDLEVCGVSTDTRSLRPGQLFVAVDGPNFRGSDYIDEAFRAGAAAVVAERGESGAGVVLRVADARAALMRLGAHGRSLVKGPVAAITGSVGKTTTKDILATLFGGRNVVAAEKSFNNAIGIPLTLMRATSATEALVVEVGASEVGEIGRLTRLVRPTHAMITRVAPAHLDGFGSIEGVAREKLSLFEGLEAGGVALVNGDDPRLAGAVVPDGVERVAFGLGERNDVVARDIQVSDEDVAFTLEGERISAPLFGHHNVMNLLGAVAMARAMGLASDEIRERALLARPPSMRMEVRRVAEMTVLYDCYNANPASMTAALESWCSVGGEGRRVAVLGDMLELGEDSAAHHRDVGRRLADLDIDRIVFVGSEIEAAREELLGRGFDEQRVLHVEDVIAGRSAILRWLESGDRVLLKGSRGMALERLFEGAA